MSSALREIVLSPRADCRLPHEMSRAPHEDCLMPGKSSSTPQEMISQPGKSLPSPRHMLRAAGHAACEPVHFSSKRCGTGNIRLRLFDLDIAAIADRACGRAAVCSADDFPLLLDGHGISAHALEGRMIRRFVVF